MLAASVKKGCFVKHKLLKSTGMHSIRRFKQKQRARDDVGKGEGDPLWATLILLVLREREPADAPQMRMSFLKSTQEKTYHCHWQDVQYLTEQFVLSNASNSVFQNK